MPKVAVITRTKDRPLFLRRAIQSVAAQTFADYIQVIVNDGGNKSELEEVITSFDDTQQAKIKVFHRAEPSNAPDTIFNESIDRISSDYVAIHDDDDTWHPEFLERTVAVLDGGAAGVVVRTDNIYEEVVSGKIVRKKNRPYMPDLRTVSLYRQCLDNQLTALAFVYRRDAYTEVGKYDNNLPVVGDWEFGIRFLRRFEVEYCDPGFALAYYHRRLNGENSFSNHDHRKYVTLVANQYLREDLSSGRLGLGYIISKLKYDQDVRNTIVKSMLPKFVIKRIRRR